MTAIKNSPNLDQLYNNQDAQCYLFAIFFVKMVNKYESGSLSSWVSSLSSWVSSSSSWLSPSLSSLSLTDKETAKWELLYNRMIAAKKRYEAAGGKVDKNDRYVR